MKPHIDLANAFIRELKLHGTAIIDNEAKTLPQNTQTRTIPNTNMIFDPTSHIANLKIKAYCDKMNQELKTRLLQGKRTAPTQATVNLAEPVHQPTLERTITTDIAHTLKNLSAQLSNAPQKDEKTPPDISNIKQARPDDQVQTHL